MWKWVLIHLTPPNPVPSCGDPCYREKKAEHQQLGTNRAGGGLAVPRARTGRGRRSKGGKMLQWEGAVWPPGPQLQWGWVLAGPTCLYLVSTHHIGRGRKYKINQEHVFIALCNERQLGYDIGKRPNACPQKLVRSWYSCTLGTVSTLYVPK